jgi:hypothetical protein
MPTGKIWYKNKWLIPSDVGLNPETNRQKVVRLRKTNPCLTTTSIGNEVGISRERVRQILKSSGLQTRKYYKRYVCNNCGEKIIPSAEYNSKLFCSRECHDAFYEFSVECAMCGKLFTITNQYINRRLQPSSRYNGLDKIFCSKLCWQNYFRTHVNEILKRTATWIDLTCDICGKNFKRRGCSIPESKKDNIKAKFYCSLKCWRSRKAI